MREDLDNHLRLFDGGDNLEVAATLRAVFEVDIEHALPATALSSDAQLVAGPRHRS